MGTSSYMAIIFLKRNGLSPIDLGRGKGRGLRWLESDVLRVMKQVFDKVQRKPRKPRMPSIPGTNGQPLSEHTNAEIVALVENSRKDRLTPCQIIQ